MISLQRGLFDPKIQVQGVAPPIIFARLIRPMNALQLCRFAFFRPSLGDLGATYNDHLRLIGKCVVGCLLVLIELFLARCYG